MGGALSRGSTLARRIPRGRLAVGSIGAVRTARSARQGVVVTGIVWTRDAETAFGGALGRHMRHVSKEGLSSMNRREMVKLSLLSGGALLLSAETNHAVAVNQVVNNPTGGVFNPPSPPVTPFVEELRRMPRKTPLPGGVNDLSLPANGGVAPNGTIYPQITGNDALTTYMNSLERIVAPNSGTPETMSSSSRRCFTR
jgi:hypothetical protein